MLCIIILECLKIVLLACCRGKQFRQEFANLGEVQSLIPETAHYGVDSNCHKGIKTSSLPDSWDDQAQSCVTVSPNRPNIKYVVYSKPGTLEEVFAPLVEELKRLRLSMERTIIFCRTYDDCSMLYLYMRDRLGEQFTDPVGAPDRARYRVIDMYTACTHPAVKEQVLAEFCDTHSKLRVVMRQLLLGWGWTAQMYGG